MKKSILITMMFLSTHFMLDAQIVLEHTYPANNYQAFPTIIHFENGGDKWFIPIADSNIFYLYNLDYTSFKTIIVPVQPNHNYWIFNVSDKLFDLDASIEYMVADFYNTKVLVYKEDGSVLFSRGDSANHAYYGGIFNTAAGTKMIMSETLVATGKSISEIYSLPGHLPYGQSDIQSSNSGRCIINVYPNPNKGNATIEYQLLPGETQGQIIFYDLKGNMRKSVNVVGQTGHINIDNTDLPAGTYLYQINSGSATSEMKKMILIN